MRSIDDGRLPALAALRDEGFLGTVTSVFPSVTGPAYAPFLMGRYPGEIGLPGLRWFDRTQRVARMPGHSRSYVGAEMRLVDRDIDPNAPTIFELARPSFGALSVITRGLKRRDRIGQNPGFVARAATTHFRGNVRGWLNIDREVGEEAARRLRTESVKFAFIAMTGIDKTSHAGGHESGVVADAMRIVDDTVAKIRADAERDGRWSKIRGRCPPASRRSTTCEPMNPAPPVTSTSRLSPRMATQSISTTPRMRVDSPHGPGRSRASRPVVRHRSPSPIARVARTVAARRGPGAPTRRRRPQGGRAGAGRRGGPRRRTRRRRRW